MEDNLKIYVLFNSKTRQLTSFTFDVSVFPKPILDTLLVKEYSFEELGLTDNNINLNRFRWIGDYDTGSLIDTVKDKKAIVTEKETNAKYSKLFFKKYDVETILFELILNADMSTDSGKEMQRFLKKVLDKKTADIEFYKNSDLHIWETEDDEKKRQKDAFKT